MNRMTRISLSVRSSIHALREAALLRIALLREAALLRIALRVTALLRIALREALLWIALLREALLRIALREAALLRIALREAALLRIALRKAALLWIALRISVLLVRGYIRETACALHLSFLGMLIEGIGSAVLIACFIIERIRGINVYTVCKFSGSTKIRLIVAAEEIGSFGSRNETCSRNCFVRCEYYLTAAVIYA